MRIGLVGVGRHGSRYGSHLAAGDVPGVSLEAFWRRDEERGRALAASTGARFHDTIEALLEDPRVDAVVMAVPAGLHRDIATRVARAGKPLLIEKPLATTVEDARAIVEQFRSAGLPLSVAQTLRFDPLVRELDARTSAMGSLLAFVFEQRIEPKGIAWEDDPKLAGGGVFLQNGIHAVDVLRFLTRPEKVSPLSFSRAASHFQRLEDHALAVLSVTGGVLAGDRSVLGSVHVSQMGGSRHLRLALYFEAGALEADLVGRTLTTARGRERTVELVGEVRTVVEILQAFRAFIESSRENPVAPEDALESLELVLACYSGGSTIARSPSFL